MRGAPPALLPAALREGSPWRNGGGVTYEVAVHPPGADLRDFEWRVSVAAVGAAGPFSAFPGIERQLLVLEGTLHLQLAGATLQLGADSAPLVFAGEAPAAARPEGHVHDLNVMTRRDRFRASVQRRGGSGVHAVVARVSTLLLFARTPLAWEGAGPALALGRWDALRLEGGSGQVRGCGGPADFYEIALQELAPRERG
ncbi:MAG: HutD family protein [Gammaproteobacteria bacterium]|nr:HutD family protein [Gammaproteobacteria bacterium]MBV9697260.1 HutD family protein [Gammaproteobacteria bacterium]